MGTNRAWGGQRISLCHDQRPHPGLVEILLLLLGDKFFSRVGHGWRWQQVQFEFGNGQKQSLRRAQLGVLNFAMALGHDSTQYLTPATGLGIYIPGQVGHINRCKLFSAGLFCQCLGVEVLPQVIDAARDLRIVSAKVANWRNKADGCGMNV